MQSCIFYVSILLLLLFGILTSLGRDQKWHQTEVLRAVLKDTWPLLYKIREPVLLYSRGSQKSKNCFWYTIAFQQKVWKSLQIYNHGSQNSQGLVKISFYKLVDRLVHGSHWHIQVFWKSHERSFFEFEIFKRPSNQTLWKNWIWWPLHIFELQKFLIISKKKNYKKVIWHKRS